MTAARDATHEIEHQQHGQGRAHHAQHRHRREHRRRRHPRGKGEDGRNEQHEAGDQQTRGERAVGIEPIQVTLNDERTNRIAKRGNQHAGNPRPAERT